MGANNIKKDYLFYMPLYYYVKWAFEHYYPIKYYGKDKLKIGDSYIFAPNHQNALIDPLAVLFTYHPKMLFFARADIFKNKIIANILHALKMLPVFRIRDGYDQIKRNQDIFDLSLEMVANGNGLVVFPEASHHDQRRLRALKKGMVRVAFQSQLKFPDKNISIVPVALEYSEFTPFASDVRVFYSDPISVSPFIDEFKSNESKALLDLNKVVKAEISRMMVDIQYSDHRYELIESLIDITYLNQRSKGIIDSDNLENKVILAREINNIDFDQHQDLLEHLKVYNSLKIKATIKEISFINLDKTYLPLAIVVLILLSPLILLSFILNYPPYLISIISSLKFDDKQFHGTMQFVVSALITFPVFYTVYLFYGLSIFNNNALVILGLLVAMFYSIYPLKFSIDLISIFYQKTKFFFLDNALKEELKNKRSFILNKINSLLNSE